jgi:Flp pilus assembly protein TadB
LYFDLFHPRALPPHLNNNLNSETKAKNSEYESKKQCKKTKNSETKARSSNAKAKRIDAKAKSSETKAKSSDTTKLKRKAVKRKQKLAFFAFAFLAILSASIVALPPPADDFAVHLIYNFAVH